MNRATTILIAATLAACADSPTDERPCDDFTAADHRYVAQLCQIDATGADGLELLGMRAIGVKKPADTQGDPAQPSNVSGEIWNVQASTWTGDAGQLGAVLITGFEDGTCRWVRCM